MSDENRRRGGRRRHIPPLRKRLVTLTDEQAALARRWGKGDLSAGLRWLIDSASNLIVRVSDLEKITSAHVLPDLNE